MARNKNNNVVKGLSGKLGDVVFSQSDGETFASRKRGQSSSITPNQVAARENFQRASIFAQGILKDPLMAALYKGKAQGRRSAYTLALADYLKGAAIHEIDTAFFDGSIGSRIRIAATSLGKILEVKVRILDATGNLVENGKAQLQEDTDNWFYAASTVLTALEGSTVSVAVKDLPGHISVANKLL